MFCGAMGFPAGCTETVSSDMPTCAVSGVLVAERCGGLSCEGHLPRTVPQVECIVQEVVVWRQAKSEPALGWLTGLARLLYVEVGVPGGSGPRRQTQTGVLLSDGSSRCSKGCEVWVFGASGGDGALGAARGDGGGERLVLPAREPAELELRVLGSHATWHLALGLRAPLDLVAEGRFAPGGGVGRAEVVVPLVRGDRACGEASLVVRYICSGDRQERPRWVEAHACEDARPYTDMSADAREVWDEAM